MAENRLGRNYDLHCPEKEECPEGSHVEDHLPAKSDSTSQQLFQEQQSQEPPAAPSKPKAPEPRRLERMGRDLTNWQDRINQGLAGGTVNRVGHDEEHPTDEQARTSTKAHEWAQARKTEREKLQKYGVYTIVHQIPPGIQPVDTKWVYDVKKDSTGNVTRYRARKVGRGFT